MSEKILPYLTLIAFIAFLYFLPDMWQAAKKRCPGLFETDNPIPDELPMSWMALCILWLIAIGWATVKWDSGGFVLMLVGGALLGVTLIHVPPYVRHQWRRMRGRAQPPPAEC